MVKLKKVMVYKSFYQIEHAPPQYHAANQSAS